MKKFMNNILLVLFKCFKRFRYNIFVFKYFSKIFREYIRMENSNYKNKNIETKYLK